MEHRPNRNLATEQAYGEPKIPSAQALSPTASADVYTYPCSHSTDKDQERLCNEWRSAKAAHTQAEWAARTFWVGVVGSLVIAITLAFTAVSARAAVLAATASLKQAEIMASTQRANIRVDEYQTIRSFEDKTNINGYGFRIHWVNVGNTAAKNVRVSVLTRYVPDNTDDPPPDVDFEIEKGGVTTQESPHFRLTLL